MKHDVIRAGIPVYVCELRLYDHTRELRFFCPHCWRDHRHGLPYGYELPTLDKPTPRGAHCDTDAGWNAHGLKGYFLAVKL
jgi:hypothetical protein